MVKRSSWFLSAAIAALLLAPPIALAADQPVATAPIPPPLPAAPPPPPAEKPHAPPAASAAPPPHAVSPAAPRHELPIPEIPKTTTATKPAAKSPLATFGKRPSRHAAEKHRTRQFWTGRHPWPAHAAAAPHWPRRHYAGELTPPELGEAPPPPPYWYGYAAPWRGGPGYPW